MKIYFFRKGSYNPWENAYDTDKTKNEGIPYYLSEAYIIEKNKKLLFRTNFNVKYKIIL